MAGLDHSPDALLDLFGASNAGGIQRDRVVEPPDYEPGRIPPETVCSKIKTPAVT